MMTTPYLKKGGVNTSRSIWFPNQWDLPGTEGLICVLVDGLRAVVSPRRLDRRARYVSIIFNAIR